MSVNNEAVSSVHFNFVIPKSMYSISFLQRNGFLETDPAIRSILFPEKSEIDTYDNAVHLLPVQNCFLRYQFKPITSITRDWSVNSQSLLLKYERPHAMGTIVGEDNLNRAAIFADWLLLHYVFDIRTFHSIRYGQHVVGLLLENPTSIHYLPNCTYRSMTAPGQFEDQ